MSTPSGQPSPVLRAAGVGLVAVALVLGAVGVLSGGDDSAGPTAEGSPTGTVTTAPSGSSTAGTGPSSTAPSGTGPSSTGPADTGPASAPPPSAGPSGSSPSGSAAPSSSAGAPGRPSGAPVPPASGSGTSGTGTTGGGAASGTGGTGGGTAAADLGVPVRVLNNSTTTGLAADAATRLERSGWRDVTVGNYPQGIIPTSTVYYRPGTAEQAAAQQIATTFGTRVEQRFEGLDDASPGVILIVTNDFPG